LGIAANSAPKKSLAATAVDSTTGIFSLIATPRLNMFHPSLELAHTSDVKRECLTNPVAMADLTHPPLRGSAIWECARRIEPRVIKRRCQHYKLMQEPREVLKARLLAGKDLQ
jgi:hypothetical protein